MHKHVTYSSFASVPEALTLLSDRDRQGKNDDRANDRHREYYWAYLRDCGDGLLQDYVQSGAITLSYREIPMNEDHIGSYTEWLTASAFPGAISVPRL